MLDYLVTRLKWKIAPDEMLELQEIKRRTSEVKVWCSEHKTVRVVCEYIENPTSYPYQAMGVHGDIADFRNYIRKIKHKESE